MNGVSGAVAGVNQAAHAIREQHVNFLGLYQCRDLAYTKFRVKHCLTLAISARPVVRHIGSSRRALFRDGLALFESATGAALMVKSTVVVAVPPWPSLMV